MTVVIPMAGSGARFVAAGYKDPKPLIKVGGKTLISQVVAMFNPADQFVFICNDTHLAETPLREHLLELVPDSVVVSMPPHKKGPVYTVKAAFEHIRGDAEVIVSYCDGVLKYDQAFFEYYIHSRDLDGCLFTHTGFQPHALSPTTKMAFVRNNSAGMVLEVKEKASFTGTPQHEHASSGVYYFKSGTILKTFFDRALAENVTYNGEYYVTLVYNLLVKEGLRVGFFDTDVAILGTPEEVRNYEAWKQLVECGYLKSADDLNRCFEYWLDFHSPSIPIRNPISRLEFPNII